MGRKILPRTLDTAQKAPRRIESWGLEIRSVTFRSYFSTIIILKVLYFGTYVSTIGPQNDSFIEQARLIPYEKDKTIFTL